MSSGDPFAAMLRVPVKNTHGTECPPFGVMKPTGVIDSEGRLEITRPTTDSDGDVLVNGPTAVPASGFGWGSYANPVVVAYDDGDGAPTGNADWGSVAGEWVLRKGKTGFRAKGGSEVGDDGATAVFSRPGFPGLGVTAIPVVALADGTAVMCQIQTRLSGEWEDTEDEPILVEVLDLDRNEPFVTGWRYWAFQVGGDGEWFADTGEKTKCVNVPDVSQPAQLNCETGQLAFTPMTIRVFDRACEEGYA